MSCLICASQKALPRRTGRRASSGLAVFALLVAGCVGTVGSTGNDGGDGFGGGAGGTAGASAGGSAGGATGGGSGGGSAGGSVAGGQGGFGQGGGSLQLGTPLTPADPGVADVRFTTRTDLELHSISPLIYGTNQPQSASQNRYGLLRMGGNRLTAFNWENSASNAGSDYMFQNDGFLSNSNTPGQAVTDIVTSANAIGAATLLTVPIVDYVAADKNGNGDVRNSGSNYLDTRFRKNAAKKTGALSPTPDANDAFVYQDEFVAWCKTQHGSARLLFSLDNEPDLWSETHPEVQPTKVTYAQLLQRNVDYAAAVKSSWPEAEVAGFVSYGFSGYVNLQNATDSAQNGDFIDYYLEHVKAASATAGHRLVDYLDLHWYPEAQGDGVRIIGTETTAGAVAARVQAPRSLWDATYSESSWIVGYYGNQPIRLLSRLRTKIDAHYPGTKLAFSEWNYGGGNHISGAVASADVLGIFGREGVGMAAYWKLDRNSTEPYADAAFRAYRNFDGQNGAFGDTSFSAVSSDVATATVYASLDAANPTRVVLVAINKSTSQKTAAITIAHPSSFSRLTVYRLTSAGPALTSGGDVSAVGLNAFRYDMPAMSVSVLLAKQ